MTGNRTGATELTGRTVSWSFDGIYRLTGETVTNDPSKYNDGVSDGLDPVGNRLSQSSSPHDIASNGFSYNADDELTGEMYDANGSVTATGGKTYSYDSQNHLISANGGAVALVYDGDGNRVAKTVSGSTTRYLVDDLNPTGYAQVVEETVNGAATRTYTYGLQRINEDQVISNVWTVSYYGYDGFGTVRQLTNSAGAVTDTYEYDGFGNEITSTGTTTNNYLYRGEQYDPDLGMYYLRARYYNPTTGRFMSRDPEDGQPNDPKSLHRYLYATGDPVDYSDPTGRDYVGTVAIDRRIDLETIPAQIALAAAISCAFELDASYLEAVPQGGPIEKSIFPCAVEEAHGTCKSKFPKLVPVNDLPGWYEFDNQYYAFQTLQEEWLPRVLKQGTTAPAESGPCAVGGFFTPGWHVNVLFAKGGGSAGSLVGCPCCDDSSGEPQPTERWGVIVNNPQ